MATIFQRFVAPYIPKSLKSGRFVVGENGFFDAQTFRYPAPGSQTPPDVSNKVFIKSRPLAKIYKYLKKRGEVQYMRPSPLFWDTEAEEAGHQKAKEYYEKEPYQVTQPRIANPKEYVRQLNATEGFDLRNLNNYKKHKSQLEDACLPKDRYLFRYEEYHVDTGDHIPKKVDNLY
ncbi:hypothetical protein DFA_01584 [Cavenderia fasciculata]|uniref:Uncharacterized protein n=1 Tax=Cavenderia fasciculata TaxID=261658 RepID=F4PTM8_CACFS|nr:uncharacterized protein DFA_01584 [Cavenderia fasciculata]EGG21698.1 hypothetical protein DFA_01584 [Cavenderia fasciculata]|eukprot:XP_004359548.1 hypothetical protein DFA_01584 [Cavenderia fasciculata]